MKSTFPPIFQSNLKKGNHELLSGTNINENVYNRY